MFHGALTGALRGAAAGAGYAILLLVLIFVQDSVEGTTGGFGPMMGLVFIALYAGFLGGVIGFAGGVVPGALLVPVVRRWPWSKRSLQAGAAATFFAVGLAAFPSVPFGGGVDDFGEVLMMKVIPASIAAAAAAWHVSALRRQAGGVRFSFGENRFDRQEGNGEGRGVDHREVLRRSGEGDVEQAQPESR